MKIARATIAQLVPHAGAMCLLDAVTAWDAQAISCTSAAPLPDHPLAREGRVPAIAAAEYAAQATAVHGALLEPSDRPRAGMLAALMEVRLGTQVVPADEGALAIRAEVLGRSAAGCLYRFEVATACTPIVSGRLLVALQAEETR
ncbi:MAG TPA: hydroxymyristoyl-ACP dehydratase [Ramlibacter sp.]|nr:hydroxymyristoyl-ACP dehydratase [Ramlibacter sp.]